MKKKTLDKRDNQTCGRCEGEMPKGRKKMKFKLRRGRRFRQQERKRLSEH